MHDDCKDENNDDYDEIDDDENSRQPPWLPMVNHRITHQEMAWRTTMTRMKTTTVIKTMTKT